MLDLWSDMARYHKARYAGIIVLGAVGYVTNAAVERLERYILRWRVA